METREDFQVMDQNLVRLNEIVVTKSSSISKNKRAWLKVAKPAAKWLIDNWDDPERIENFTKDEELWHGEVLGLDELNKIAVDRLTQLREKAEQERKKAEKEAAARKREEELKRKAVAKKTVKEKKQAKSNSQPKASPAADTKGVNKTATGKVMKWQVGDIHPWQPWVYKEIRPGHYDWRADGSGRKPVSQREGAKNYIMEHRQEYDRWAATGQAEENLAKGFSWASRFITCGKVVLEPVAPESFPTPTTAPTAKKAEERQPTAKQENVKQSTLQDLLNGCKRVKMSKSQTDIRKWLKSGYKVSIDGNMAWFKADGKPNHSVDLASLTSLMQKIGIELPNEIML